MAWLVSDKAREDAAFQQAVTILAASLAPAIEKERGHLRARLREDLAWVLARLAEPLKDEETSEDRAEQVRTGSEVDPGVYREGGTWVAWDYDPDGSGDTITVHGTEAPGG